MAWTRIVTKAGEALIASAFGATLNYTAVKAGSGSVPDADLADQIGITGFIKNLSIVSVNAVGSQSVLNARLDNTGITAETPLTQIGVFAQINNEPEVLLVILQTDTPSTIPTAAAQPGWIFEPQFNIAVSGVANFTAVIDWNAYAKISDIQNATQTMTAMFEIHINKTVMSAEGVHGIRFFEGNLQAWDGADWVNITTDPPQPTGQFSVDANGVLSNTVPFGTVTPNANANTLNINTGFATVSGQTVNLI